MRRHGTNVADEANKYDDDGDDSDRAGGLSVDGRQCCSAAVRTTMNKDNKQKDKKGRGPILAISLLRAYMSQTRDRALQSRKWQLIDMS